MNDNRLSQLRQRVLFLPACRIEWLPRCGCLVREGIRTIDVRSDVLLILVRNILHYVICLHGVIFAVLYRGAWAVAFLLQPWFRWIVKNLLVNSPVRVKEQRKLIQMDHTSLRLVRPIRKRPIMFRRLYCCIATLALETSLFGRRALFWTLFIIWLGAGRRGNLALILYIGLSWHLLCTGSLNELALLCYEVLLFSLDVRIVLCALI